MPVTRETPFVVRLRDIPPEGHQVDLALADEWTRAVLGKEPLGWTAPQAVRAHATLHKSERDVVAVGQLAGALQCACSRCTGPTSVKLDAAFDLVFVPAGDPRAEVTVIDGADVGDADPIGADCVAYSDETVDLENVLREQLLLALPYAPVCKPTCAGLCTRCGADLNDGACACPPDDAPRDLRFAALKNIKL